MKILSNKRSKIVIIAILALVSFAGVLAMAKYLYERDKLGTVKAKSFYFTSNLLEESSKDTIYLAPGTDTIEFTLGNHEDKLRYSDVDINYTIYVDDNVLDGKQSTLSSNDKSDATIKIKLSDIGIEADDNTTHTIKAIGYSVDDNKNTSYHKTLTAKFQILQDTASIYKSLDTTNSEYVLLTVWTQGDISGNVTIEFPTGVIPDNTDSVMRDAKTDVKKINDTTSFSGSGYSSHIYRFFRSSSGESSSLSVGNFDVYRSYNNETIKATEK
jgi:hypothetical protein